MAEENISLANAIVGLFNGFYKVYLKTENDSPENGCESFSGEKLNIDEDKETICIYYNSIAEQLDGIEIDKKKEIEFLTELDALPSDDLKLFLGNLLDFIKAYKLDGLTDVLEYVGVIKHILIFNQSVSALKKISDLNGSNSILNKINKVKFTNAEKYLTDLIIAVGENIDKIAEKRKEIKDPLKKLRAAYTQGTFFKDEQGMKLIVKTVKELGVTEEYGEVMKEIDIGDYYKKMSFENSELVTNGTFSSWKLLKNYVDTESNKCNIIIDNTPLDKLKEVKALSNKTELEKLRIYTEKYGFKEIKWNNKTFDSYEEFEEAFFEKIFTNSKLLEENEITEISENDKNLIKELYLMDSPHTHHVFYKGWENNRIWRWKNESEEDFEKRKSKFNANNEANKDLDEKIRKARKILWEYDIDPYVGLENLCWAPNVNPDQHNDEHIRIIAEELIALHEKKRPRDDVIKYLENMKDVAKNLWKNYNKGE